MVDGYDFVFDFEKSYGVYFYDVCSGCEYFDFFLSFLSVFLGYNYLLLIEFEFCEVFMGVVFNKFVNLDFYIVEMVCFVSKFVIMVFELYCSCFFFVVGGVFVVENVFKVVFDWKYCKN